MIDRPGRPLPVMLSEPIGGARRSFATCPPVTHLHVAADPEWTQESARPPRHNGQIYVGLIDTGADVVGISPELATAIGARLTGEGVSHGIGVPRSGVRRATIQLSV